MYNPSYIGGIGRRFKIQAGLGANVRPYLKKQKAGVMGSLLSSRVPLATARP
jgi:hypothetical protein